MKKILLFSFLLLCISCLGISGKVIASENLVFPKDISGEQLYQQGLKLVEKEKYEEAIPYFEEATKRKANFAEAYYHLGLCYIKLLDYEKARVSLISAKFLSTDETLKQKAISLIEKLPEEIKKEREKQQELKKIYKEGILLYKRGEYQRAIANLEEVIKNKNTFAEAYYYLGLCYINLLDSQKARRNLSLAKTLSNDKILKQKITALVENLPNEIERERRKQQEKQEIEKKKKEAEQWNVKGVNYAKRKMYHNAAKAFEKAVELDPNNTKYLNNLATSYHFLGRDREALKIFYKVIKLAPRGSKEREYAEGAFNDLKLIKVKTFTYTPPPQERERLEAMRKLGWHQINNKYYDRDGRYVGGINDPIINALMKEVIEKSE